MPVLPIIDLLILLGWTALAVGFVQKAIYVATTYRPLLLGLQPMAFLMIAGICLLFALALAARTWVKLNEGNVLAAKRGRDTLDAYSAVQRAAREAEEAGRGGAENEPSQERRTAVG